MHSRTSPSLTPPEAFSGAHALDRVETFRRLFLLFAVGAVVGVIVADGIGHDRSLLPMGPAGLVLAAWWLWRHARGGFPGWSAPLEAGVVVVMFTNVDDALDMLGVCFVATQYRAMYGGRTAMVVSALSYVGAFLVGMQHTLGAEALRDPIVVVQVGALFFGPFLTAKLADVLRRHAVQVADLRASRDALRASEGRFRAVVDCLREAVLITDMEDRIVLANARVQEVLGYAPVEVIGQIAGDLLLPPGHRNIFRDRMRRRLDGETELYEAELLRKDGAVMFAEISASPYRDLDGNITGTLGAISDVTDRKKLEHRLRQSLRLEAVGQLAGGVAHDFNNLLTVVRCHTELMRADIPRASGAHENVVEIERTVEKGANLIRQLLAFSGQQMLQPRPLVLAQVIADAAPLLRGVIGPRVQLTLLTEEPGEVFADPGQVEQVLLTLVRNANDALPNGGRIFIETRRRVLKADDPRVRAHDAAPGTYAVLVVSDDGVGMSPDVLTHLFEPFFTTKPMGEGTGLGVAGMYGIARQSGGFVDVETAPGRGTTFRVYLPSAPWQSVTPTRPAEPVLQST